MTIISTLTSSSSGSSCNSTAQLISAAESSQSAAVIGTSGHRWLVFGLLFFGAFTTTLSRINFNATIAEMSNDDCDDIQNSTVYEYYKLSRSVVFADNNNSNSSLEPESYKQWSESQEDTLNGAFLLGFSLALIPSCRLGSKWSSSKRVAAAGGLLRIAANLLTPVAMEKALFHLIFLLRVLVGAACSTTVPAFFELLQQAVPPGEKSKAIAALKVGSSLGSICLHSLFLLTLSVLGLTPAASWSAIFYLCSGLDLLWLVLWLGLVSEVKQSKQTCNNNSSPFLRKLLTSSRVHLRALTTLTPMAVMVGAKLTNVWLECLLTAKLPQYITTVRRMDVARTTLLSGLLSAVSFASILFSGALADLVAARQVVSLTVLRKVFEGVASLGIVLGMLLLAVCGAQPAYALSDAALLLTFSVVVAAFGLVTAGSSTIVIDMTAQGDASLIALLSTFTTVFGFVASHLMTAILNASDDPPANDALEQGAHSSASWSSVFLSTALLYALSGLLFTLFASSEKQQWRAPAAKAALTTRPQTEEKRKY